MRSFGYSLFWSNGAPTHLELRCGEGMFLGEKLVSELIPRAMRATPFLSYIEWREKSEQDKPLGGELGLGCSKKP